VVPDVFRGLCGGLPLEPQLLGLALLRLLLLGFALQMHWKLPEQGSRDLAYSVSLFTAAFLGTVGLAFLGDRNRLFAGQQDFLSRISNSMHVDLGLAESLRLLLEELCAEYQTEAALLAYRDADLERIFIWANALGGEGERLVPENLPLTARGRVPAGRYGSVARLEFAGRPRRRVRLGPPKQAGPENPAAHSRAHAAGAGHQEFHFGGV